MSGRLNGEPVGPELPAPVACGGCGMPVYHAQDIVAYDKAGLPILGGTAITLERTFTRPGQAWTLTAHECAGRGDG